MIVGRIIAALLVEERLEKMEKIATRSVNAVGKLVKKILKVK